MHDLERLRNACKAVEDRPEWREKIFDLLKYVETASLEERKSEEFHHRIWDDPISEMRRDTIDVGRAIRQVELRSWLAEESMKPLSDDPQTRSDAIEKIRIELIERVKQSGVESRPWAKATRLLAALFPLDFTTLISDRRLDQFIADFNKSFPTIQIEPQGSVPSKHQQVLERLDAALRSVPDGDLEQLTYRMILPNELMAQDKLTPESKAADDSGEGTPLPAEGTAEGKATTPQNIILYGPPGTGKTYSTIRRALELILGKYRIKDLEPSDLKSRFRECQNKGQIEFITFHQSYGYEEFVEGLRPVLDDTEGDDVRYELHNGVFKRIALQAAAEGLQKPAEGSDFDDLWDRLVAEIREDDERVVKSISGKSYVLRLSRPSNPQSIKTFRCELYGDGDEDEENYTVTDKEMTASKTKSKILWDKRSTFGEQPENLKREVSDQIFGVGVHYTALWIVYKHLFELSSQSATVSEDLQIDNTVRRAQQALDQAAADGSSFSFSAETPQYVLIIDEINRGNVSKILGELITLLEPDKRLEADNELRLPLSYSPSHRFGVPPNLHILGTMNTADRSIALMDVALRRRFTFEELMPDAEVICCELKRKLPDKAPLINLVVDLFNTLNKRIRFLYDRDHQLGHAYFLEVKDLEDLRLVFVNRVIPLLQEYFYGDWHKICVVLGCPYDENDGQQNNDSPIVKASRFLEKNALGFNLDEYEDRVDFSVSEDFLLRDRDKMTDDAPLARMFLGVLQIKGDELKRRSRELIGSGFSSDTDEADEDEVENNQ